MDKISRLKEYLPELSDEQIRQVIVICTKNGVRVRSDRTHSNKKFTPEIERNIAKAYNAGIPIRVLAGKYRCAYNTIKSILIRGGVFKTSDIQNKN